MNPSESGLPALRIRKLSPEETVRYFPPLVNPRLDQPVLDAGHSYECLNKPGGGLGTCVCGLNYRNARSQPTDRRADAAAR